MWATPFEIMLANLRQQMPEASYRRTVESAYEELKSISGQDFGYDAMKWEEWGFENRMFMNPPRFLRYFGNFAGLVSKGSLYYMSREEAHQKLKELSGKDFGDDLERWRIWGRENGHVA